MRKTLFNHYKLRRKLTRRFSHSRPHAAIDIFAGTNPYRSHNSRKLKILFEAGILIASILGFLALMIFHHSFHIQHIHISGLERIHEQEFNTSIRSIIEYKIASFIPAQTYVFVDTTEIEQILLEKFPLESVSVKKIFPDALHINAREKISTVIYDNGSFYYYVDLQGTVIEITRVVGQDEWVVTNEITTTTLADGTVRTNEKIVSQYHTIPINLILREMGNYPIIYQNTSSSENIGIGSKVLDEQVIHNIISWYTLLKEMNTAPFGYIEVDTAQRFGEIHTRGGWQLKIRLKENSVNQFQNFKEIVSKLDQSKIQYIDLRYPPRVYWQ